MVLYYFDHQLMISVSSIEKYIHLYKNYNVSRMYIRIQLDSIQQINKIGQLLSL